MVVLEFSDQGKELQKRISLRMRSLDKKFHELVSALRL